MDARVQDYLDDRLQSSADLESLDTLLESVRTQQALLKKQLDETRHDHIQAQDAADSHVASVKAKAAAFQEKQADIDRRLLLVTQSETSDDAVREFEASMDRLRKLDVASGYIELLLEVDRLSSECRSQLTSSDDAAVGPYRRLQNLAHSLGPLREAAEGAAPHLLDHIAQQLHNLRATIQQHFSADLEKTLKKMNWPKASETVPLALESEWARNVGRLLDLQRPDLEAREAGLVHTGVTGSEEPPALLPLELIVHPLEQRFKYHFSGNKPTNRLDKPEYFLTHASDLISGYSDFLRNALQPLLVKHYRGTDLALTPAYMDATSAFITALLPMLRRKLSSFASQVADKPSLLSHLIHEVIGFDTTLQESYAYAPASPSTPWRGLAYFLLDTCGFFQRWLDVERDFALSRYQSIIEAPEAGELDYDSVASDATKPSRRAIRVNDLLETITDRYRPLSSFSQKLRFLIDIQIAIFDKFHSRLHSGLEAYMTMTSSVGRTVHGVTKQDQNQLQGVKGLDRLCRVFGSAEYLERAMRDWSDDVFFLELWEELQFRASNRDRISRNLGTLQDIQAKISSAVGSSSASPDGATGGSGEAHGALFDETADAYRRLRVRSEGIIVETLTWNMREALRPYARVNTWASLSAGAAAGGGGGGGSLSAELDPTLRLLAEYLGFLGGALGRAPLRRVARQLCHAVQAAVWDGVLMRHSFSTAGAAQLAADVAAVCAGIDRYVGAGQARAGLRRLCEGVALLSLPVKGEVEVGRGGDGGVPDAGAEDEDRDGAAWEEGDGDADGGREDGAGEAGRRMGLFEVERMVFMDNEHARQAMERMGLEVLSEADARLVLERRVEVAI